MYDISSLRVKILGRTDLKLAVVWFFSFSDRMPKITLGKTLCLRSAGYIFLRFLVKCKLLCS